jgi:hypothetical protein
MKRVTYASLLALILIFSIKRANAQSSIIGNPIRLGNIEVAQYDFPNRMSFKYCIIIKIKLEICTTHI